jgi:hypothetical protein
VKSHDDPHGDVEHDARGAEEPEHDEQHPHQGHVDVEVRGQATAHPATCLLVLLRYSFRVWSMAPPFLSRPASQM